MFDEQSFSELGTYFDVKHISFLERIKIHHLVAKAQKNNCNFFFKIHLSSQNRIIANTFHFTNVFNKEKVSLSRHMVQK